MTEETKRLSDAEIFELLKKAQESYEQYLNLLGAEVPEQVMPTYTSANPIGLVTDAVVD